MKPKTCTLEETRCFVKLLESGYSFQMCMEYLRTEQNSEVFERMKNCLQNGEEMESWLPLVMPFKISAHLNSFLKFLPVSEALSLAVELYDQNQRTKSETIKCAGGPIVLFYVSLVGVLMFCLFCMPHLISMMDGFHVSTIAVEVLFHLMMVISLFFITASVLICVMGFVFTRKHRIVLFVIVLYQMNLGFLIQKELSLNFARLLYQCIQMGIPTKKSLEIMKQCVDQPLMVFLAWHVEQVLEKGGNLEEAMSISYLDQGLQRVMKTSVLSGSVEGLLSGYLLIAEHQRQKRLQTMAKTIQITAYAMIAVMIVLVYQILFLPLSMLERM